MPEILNTKSIKCGTASLASYQYSFVKIDSSGLLALPSAGGYAVGVLQEKPTAGSPGSVCSPGNVTKVMCGAGGFNAGGDVATDASGYAVAATSGHYVLGIALEAGVNGFLATILYQPKASSGSLSGT